LARPPHISLKFFLILSISLGFSLSLSFWSDGRKERDEIKKKKKAREKWSEKKKKREKEGRKFYFIFQQTA
jgi:hypothetical protein